MQHTMIRQFIHCSKHTYLIVIQVLIFHALVLAGNEQASVRLSGTALLPNVPVIVQDNKYLTMQTNSNWSALFTNHKVENRIVLAVDPASLTYVSTSYWLAFNLKIDYETANGTLNTYNKTLEIEYNPAAAAKPIDKSVFRFTGGYKVKVEVISITDKNTNQAVSNPPDNIYLEAQIDVKRYYSFNAASVPAAADLVDTYEATSNELEIKWKYIPGAEEYDLEWTYVNNYAEGGASANPANLLYNFRNNATRVTLTAQSYRLPLVFDRGYVLYRVRGVGRGGNDFDKRIPGKWSADGQPQGNVAAFPHFYYIDAHEGAKNWQYNVSFAEEGKRKESVNYFDGSLRNRQTVAASNTDNKTIVGETIYDYQGRPAIQVLPVPSGQSKIGYVPDFNKSVSDNTSYNRSHFDVDLSTPACSTDTKGMSATSGASRYYSSSNPDQALQQKYVPDAALYPFTQVEYEPDNTGRIKRQSGVGATHKLGQANVATNHHETRYYYGQPFQEELDRLFGSEVGYKSHYKKNMVMDPNGQISVSYLDEKGRVIATALAGDNSFNTTTLPGRPNATSMSIDLLNKENAADKDTERDNNQLSIEGDALTFSSELLVVSSGIHTFSYNLNGAGFTESCLPYTCFKCVYDIKIDIKDECGTSVDGFPASQTVGKMATGCSAYPTFSLTPNPVSVTLAIGKYTVYKKLEVNKDTLDAYWNKYLADNTCLSTEQSFIDAEISKMDTSLCEVSCENCISSLGSDSAYIAAGGTAAGYQKEVKACKALCDEISPCQASYQLMLADVSPGGQYAQYQNNEGLTDPSNYPLSVLNTANRLPQGISWQEVENYKNEDGTDSYIVLHQDENTGSFLPEFNDTPVLVNGVYQVRPNKLKHLPDFLANWKDSWAEALVVYHPEYCYYNWCKNNALVPTGASKSSDEFDRLMQSTTSYTIAANSGLIQPVVASQINTKDPYFSAGQGASHHEEMVTKLNSYASGYSMWKNAYIMHHYGTTYVANLTELETHAGSGPGSPALINTDGAWEKFKMLYMAEKKKFQDADAKAYATSNGCYNGCIGAATYDPVAGGTNASSQSCSPDNYALYQGKQKRFGPDPESSLSYDELKNKTEYELYLQTGQCPLAKQLESLLTALAVKNKLTDATSLKGFPEFTPDLYQNIKSKMSNPPAQFLEFTWNPSIDGLSLNTNLNSSSGSACLLDLSFYTDYNWYTYLSGFKISRFKGLRILNKLPDDSYNFNVFAEVDDDNNPATPEVDVMLYGNTCIAISDCSFQLPCEPSAEAQDLKKLWNMLLTNNQFESNNIDVSGTASSYAPIFNNHLHSYLGQGTCQWKKNGSFYEIYNSTSNKTVRISFVSLPSGLTSFTKIAGDAAPGSFTATAMAGTTAYPVTGTVQLLPDNMYINMGRCPDETSKECKTLPHKLLPALTEFLNSIAPGITTSSLDLTYNPKFAPELKTQLGISPGTSSSWNVLSIASDKSTLEGAISINGLGNRIIKLFMVDPVSSAYNLGTVTGFADLYADESKLVNGDAYEFTVHVTFADGTIKLVKGSSGIPIRNCYTCKDELSINLIQNGNFNEKSISPCSPVKFSSDLILDCQPATGGAGYYAVDESAEIWNPAFWMGDDREKGVVLDSSNFIIGDAPSTNSRAWFQTVTVSKGKTYEFGAWVRNNCKYCDGEGDPSFELRVGGLNGTLLYGSAPIPFDYQDFFHDSYTYINGFYLAQADGPVELDIIIAGGGGYGHDFGIDDVVFRARGCVPPDNTTPVTKLVVTEQDSLVVKCKDYLKSIAITNGRSLYEKYIADIKHGFKRDYIRSCIGNAVETFTMQYRNQEYHHTLYYYDQAGNLVQTIPPAGVKLVTNAGDLNQVRVDRKAVSDNPNAPRFFFTSHIMATSYKYNALNQLTEQTTPDGGTSKFWYDQLGRLRFSQNAKQAASLYSYTKYDALGRIIEVGESSSNYNGTAFYNGVNSAAFPSSDNTQITRTFYDVAAYTIPGFTQQHLRSRVSSTSIDDDGDGTYEHATHYSYDIHGNVSSLVQENVALAASGHSLKRTDYEYDLVSGNVNAVHYQKGQPDQFHHQYEYDADNRISNVYTSKDSVIWDQDAKYFYYQHGPLARVELGDQKVQGLDYVYTLQGWIKGVNSNSLKETLDPGADGNTTQHKYVSRDAYGYSLGYYNTTTKKDYMSIGGVNSFIAGLTAASYLSTDAPSLYNGNINHMVSTITNPSTGAIAPQLTAYQYDQLNRVKQMKAYRDLNTTTNAWGNGSGYNDSYKTTVSYDANGNISTMLRNGLAPNLAMDNLKYYYWNKNETAVYDPAGTVPADASNKLAYVADNAGGTYTTDIDNQFSGNYKYDAIGNLVHDLQEEINDISWTVYGKIKRIRRLSTSSRSNIEFTYDAQGNRVSKRVKPKTAPGVEAPSNLWVTTYYVRDAQGNVLSIYEQKPDAQNVSTLYQTEQHVYGSSRIGIKKSELKLSTAVAAPEIVSRQLGSKNYELSNHLGNVLSVVTDRKLPFDVGGNGSIDYFTPHIIASTDYGIWGDELTGRSFNSVNSRYGFNGQEKVDEIVGSSGSHYDFKYRGYDPRIGRFWSVDPLFKKYAWNSPYAFAENRVIDGIDFEGLEYVSAASWAPNMNGMDYSYRDQPYSFKFYQKATKQGLANEVSCYESCMYAYAQANQLVSEYLKEQKIPVSRVPGMDWFKKGGDYHSFIGASNFLNADKGDILFMGEPTSLDGHAAILASKPVLSEDGNSFTVEVNTVLADSDRKYGQKTYTFNKDKSGNWVGLNETLRGFGRVDEAKLSQDKLLEQVKFIPSDINEDTSSDVVVPDEQK